MIPYIRIVTQYERLAVFNLGKYAGLKSPGLRILFWPFQKGQKIDLREDVFDIPTTSVSTFALLMSSMSMVLAYSAINRGNIRGFRVWILSTCLLGAAFLGFQVFEFYEFSQHGLSPRTNLFGTTFFTLTGFHGAHVTVGVIWLLSIFGYSLFGGKKADRILADREALSVDLAALYWHFVDIVWIVIFAVVYLIGVGVT